VNYICINLSITCASHLYKPHEQPLFRTMSSAYTFEYSYLNSFEHMKSYLHNFWFQFLYWRFWASRWNVRAFSQMHL